MVFLKHAVWIAGMAVWFWLASERDALAYLDPGSGSMMLQLILGGIAAFFFTLKIYWKRLMAFFSGKKDASGSDKNSKQV